MKPTFFSFFPAIGWFILSFILLTLPGKDIPTIGFLGDFPIDKVVHITMFGVLVLLFLIPFKQKWQQHSFLKPALIAGIIALIYGTIMEFVQKYYIPNRSFDVLDIVADGVGSFLPALWLAIKFRKQKSNA